MGFDGNGEAREGEDVGSRAAPRVLGAMLICLHPAAGLNLSPEIRQVCTTASSGFLVAALVSRSGFPQAPPWRLLPARGELLGKERVRPCTGAGGEERSSLGASPAARWPQAAALAAPAATGDCSPARSPLRPARRELLGLGFPTTGFPPPAPAPIWHCIQQVVSWAGLGGYQMSSFSWAFLQHGSQTI